MSIREPDKFRLIYKSKIEDTGEKIYRVPSTAYPLIPPQNIPPEIIATHESEPVIAIKMPYTEYQQFCNHWDLHMDIIKEAKENPIVREQYEKLIMLVRLYK